MDIIYLVFAIKIIEMSEGMLHRRRCKCLQAAAFLLFSGLKSSVLKLFWTTHLTANMISSETLMMEEVGDGDEGGHGGVDARRSRKEAGMGNGGGTLKKKKSRLWL
ncbi:hypothetical protein NC652_027517 [Populus alba x Populus x berolinensis]|nr:hypothetical protein NC652_027517 [Populus alba x Populus x berolinensis]